ncbi:unnamed protein product [Dibothriocephalus latus]|uniref:Fibronectin type-III domain-containing protein n=1 Tax=Dibothriocephalus latus TaxID=60516 RepID=A0A3P6TX28_DIBLA|nr:unnamed protein product [Dibothriocephalus latus]
MMPPPALLEENADQLFKLSPSVEGLGETWIQLSWAPPSIRGPHLLPPPEGYLVSVRRQHYKTPDQVYQILIPWGSKQQLDELGNQVTGVLSSLHYKYRPTPANLDVPWPDYKSSRINFWIDGWNNGSVDDRGPQNLFVFTASGLRDGQAYIFTIVPLFLPALPSKIDVMQLSSSLGVTTGGSSYDISLKGLRDSINVADTFYLQMVGLSDDECFTSDESSWKISSVDAVVIARNLLSARFRLPKGSDLPLASIIYLCPPSAEDCKSSAQITYVVGTYELQWGLSFCRIEESLFAECFLRLKSNLSGRRGLERLNLQMRPYFGIVDENNVGSANTSFYLLNSLPCKPHSVDLVRLESQITLKWQEQAGPTCGETKRLLIDFQTDDSKPLRKEISLPDNSDPSDKYKEVQLAPAEYCRRYAASLILQNNAGSSSYANTTGLPIGYPALNKVDVANVSVLPLEIENDGSRTLTCPLSQHDPSPRFFQAVDIRASPKLSMCLEVSWDFLSARTGVFGFILVIKSSETPSDAGANANRTGFTNANCRTIWIPCSNCVGKYTWKNSKDIVLEDMLKVFESCGSNRRSKRAASSVTEELEQHLRTSSTLEGTLKAEHERVVLQLFLSEKDKPTPQGVNVQLYALKALQMQLAIQQAWGKIEKGLLADGIIHPAHLINFVGLTTGFGDCVSPQFTRAASTFDFGKS